MESQPYQVDAIKELIGVRRPEIRFGDCLAIMREMPSESVDLIITSPPYGNARSHTYGGVDPNEYVEWFGERAVEMKRLLKPAGSLILNIKEGTREGERETYVLKLILHMKEELGWRWVDEYIWHKKTAMPGRWRNRFKDAWERVLHFSKTLDIKMNKESVKVPVAGSTIHRLRNTSEDDPMEPESGSGSGFRRRLYKMKHLETADPSNVLWLPPVTTNVGHSAAFPELLPEFFVKLFTDEGDVVLDPFVGSGTSCRVAYGLSRNSIGIELNPDQRMNLG